MYAAVRVRGVSDVNKKARKSLKHIGLDKKNNGVLLPERDEFRGMLKACKDFVTFGEIDSELAADLIELEASKKGRKAEESLESYDSVDEFVEAVDSGEASFSNLEGLNNVLSLHPPKKGYKDTRTHYNQGGSLGDRGEDIDKLIERMAKVGKN
ncbi:MAG: 50S ribosomal protein L30 [Candidatus Nanohaloarchaea archaeon]|nr:50S ribosomal protein L30 [Candidatus Nanohaloarchaea archaeon]